MECQQTIAKEVVYAGQALHCGKYVTMNIRALPENSGIWFQRTDILGQPKVKASVDTVVDTRRSVSVGEGNWFVGTIEHLMAAFYGLGIDNALVLVDGPELPIGDGSALRFMELLCSAGTIEQKANRRILNIKKPIWIESIINEHNQSVKASIVGLPSDILEISCLFYSPHPIVGAQQHYFSEKNGNFKGEIAPARTIAFIEEIEMLRSKGLALCDDWNCAAIVGNEGFLNEFRFTNEFARHKILDLMGDLYLAGHVTGHFIAIRPGHTLDVRFVKLLVAEKEGFDSEC
jgi:UDP-3-O-[3-hydroxymyristoyl] N-acetylglucosamine deacetylase